VHSFDLLDAEQHVEAAAERIAVDQQDTKSAPSSLEREGRGQTGCAGTPDSAHHRHDAGVAATINGRRQCGKCAVTIRRVQDVFGAEGHPLVPRSASSRHHEDARTSRWEGASDLRRKIIPHEHKLRAAPRSLRHPRIADHIGDGPDRRAPVEHDVEKRIIRCAEQRW
jgi:hypothetical protein